MVICLRVRSEQDKAERPLGKIATYKKCALKRRHLFLIAIVCDAFSFRDARRQNAIHDGIGVMKETASSQSPRKFI